MLWRVQFKLLLELLKQPLLFLLLLFRLSTLL